MRLDRTGEPTIFAVVFIPLDRMNVLTFLLRSAPDGKASLDRTETHSAGHKARSARGVTVRSTLVWEVTT